MEGVDVEGGDGEVAEAEKGADGIGGGSSEAMIVTAATRQTLAAMSLRNSRRELFGIDSRKFCAYMIKNQHTPYKNPGKMTNTMHIDLDLDTLTHPPKTLLPWLIIQQPLRCIPHPPPYLRWHLHLCLHLRFGVQWDAQCSAAAVWLFEDVAAVILMLCPGGSTWFIFVGVEVESIKSQVLVNMTVNAHVREIDEDEQGSRLRITDAVQSDEPRMAFSERQKAST
ncbi:hypothetical protein CVT26_011135 [Gymnopilus dilepis]|uniref:Uncharacterized protein n=1 Tax=Gymnopilus dilepis TaxID=231916 RepID=A0A409VYV0_9AGAR|nr:hypothetical protein CVT26_011135 [Gymnopilus dilepis]